MSAGCSGKLFKIVGIPKTVSSYKKNLRLTMLSPGKQHVYLPREQSKDFQGISTDVCDFSVVHLGMSSSCLADRDGGKWCQKRVNKTPTGSPKEWRLCDESCPIALEKGKYLS